jgi:acyl-CoA synthetase (NDP forming)
VAAVEECGGRAVLKAVVPGLVHKSDAGGVIVGVTPGEAPTAYTQVAALGGEVWVEEQVAGGVEALVGLSPSPLGTVLTVGVGGVLTEVMADVALRVLPVSRHDVESMIDETRLGTLLAGVRGAPRADRGTLVEAVERLAALAGSWPEGFELDLNPVAVLPEGQGVRVLDAAYVAPATEAPVAPTSPPTFLPDHA